MTNSKTANQFIDTPKIEYRDSEGACYTEEMQASSSARKFEYDHLHTTICKQDCPCTINITVDVEKLERKRSISRFND